MKQRHNWHNTHYRSRLNSPLADVITLETDLSMLTDEQRQQYNAERNIQYSRFPDLMHQGVRLASEVRSIRPTMEEYLRYNK